MYMNSKPRTTKKDPKIYVSTVNKEWRNNIASWVPMDSFNDGEVPGPGDIVEVYDKDRNCSVTAIVAVTDKEKGAVYLDIFWQTMNFHKEVK